jgi:hypothetical protein
VPRNVRVIRSTGRSRGNPLRVDLVAKKRPSKTHWYAYDVLLEGVVIVSESRDPELDLARALLARGHAGLADVIDARTGKPRSRVSIDKAARLETIAGPKGPFWRRQQIPTDRAYAAEARLRDRRVAARVLPSAEGLSVE